MKYLLRTPQFAKSPVKVHVSSSWMQVLIVEVGEYHPHFHHLRIKHERTSNLYSTEVSWQSLYRLCLLASFTWAWPRRTLPGLSFRFSFYDIRRAFTPIRNNVFWNECVCWKFHPLMNNGLYFVFQPSMFVHILHMF